MRLWHYKLLPYLPDAQFRGQLRELVAIMHDWRDKGKTNHVLINQVIEYPKSDLCTYFWQYVSFYVLKYNKYLNEKIMDEFEDFSDNGDLSRNIFLHWHNKTYLRICMANLYEKHLGIGRSHITDQEWKRLCDGYKAITGEEYKV